MDSSKKRNGIIIAVVIIAVIAVIAMAVHYSRTGRLLPSMNEVQRDIEDAGERAQYNLDRAGDAVEDGINNTGTAAKSGLNTITGSASGATGNAVYNGDTTIYPSPTITNYPEANVLR